MDMSIIPMESSTQVSRQQRNARSRPGAKVDRELQFVNVVPNNPDYKTETRSIIRANAAHFHWRHNRPRDKSKLKKSRHGAVFDHEEIISRPLPLLNTQLGFDVLDPFSSYDCELPRDFVNRCITYSKQNAPVILTQLIASRCSSHPARSIP
jgi:hypothetical protein